MLSLKTQSYWATLCYDPQDPPSRCCIFEEHGFFENIALVHLCYTVSTLIFNLIWWLLRFYRIFKAFSLRSLQALADHTTLPLNVVNLCTLLLRPSRLDGLHTFVVCSYCVFYFS